MAPPLPSVEFFGDAAVLITLDTEATEASAARAQALARRIRESVREGDPLGAVVPAATSVLVHIGPARGGEAAIDRLRELAGHLEPEDERWPDDSPTVEIPTRYGGDDGPDLQAAADATGLSTARVIELHAGAEYRALFLGFVPGFAYLGPLPRELVLPRRATPRVRVPAGSVAIAGTQAAVYPIESPGGWHLLGRTASAMWDPRRDPPALLEPGTRVRFVPEQR
jgi:KipI family sensor histidine kinase inhibitor